MHKLSHVLAVVMSLALSPLAGARAAGASEPSTQRPNIILIVLDDVGRDKLSFYGQTPVNGPLPAGQTGNWDGLDSAGQPLVENVADTPNLARIATQGVKFVNAYATPLCSPSRAQLLSGGYGHETGILALADETTSRRTLPPGGLTADGLLPAYLHSLGYKTGAFGKWHLTGTHTEYMHPITCGFDVFQGHMVNNEASHHQWNKISIDTLAGPPPANPQPIPQSTWDAEVTCADATTFIDRFQAGGSHAGQPFFAYVAINAPHKAFQLPPLSSLHPQSPNPAGSLLDQINRINGWALDNSQYNQYHVAPTCAGCVSATQTCYHQRLYYRAMLEAVDYQIGVMLGSSGTTVTDLDNTIVLVIGDNGTVAGVMQSVGPQEAPLNGPPYAYLHAKRSIFELGIGVPFVAYGPPAYVATGVCSGLISTVDFWKTIAELAGGSYTTPLPPPSGLSFSHWLLNPTTTTPTQEREFVYQEIATDNGFCFDGTTWKKCEGGPFTPTGGWQRAVIHKNGAKYISRWQPSSTGGAPCPGIPSNGPGLQFGCTVPPQGTHQFTWVFGPGSSIQQNETIMSIIAPPTQNDLICEMYRLSGK